MDPNHTTMIVLIGDRREVVTRPGHLDVKSAIALAERAGGKLHVLRHHRSLPQPGKVEVIRIQAIEPV